MVRRVFGCNHKKSVELFRFRACPWDTAGGQLECSSTRRLGHHARPFVTKKNKLLEFQQKIPNFKRNFDKFCI